MNDADLRTLQSALVLEETTEPVALTRYQPFSWAHPHLRQGCMVYGKGLVPPLMVLSIAYRRSVVKWKQVDCCGFPRKLQEAARDIGTSVTEVRSALQCTRPGSTAEYVNCRLNPQEAAKFGRERLANWSSKREAILSCFFLGLFMLPYECLGIDESVPQPHTACQTFADDPQVQFDSMVQVVAGMIEKTQMEGHWDLLQTYKPVLIQVGHFLAERNPEQFADWCLTSWAFCRSRYSLTTTFQGAHKAGQLT